VGAIYRKYPFSANATQEATLAEVNSILRKPDGQLWTFYDSSLQKYLPKQGNQYVPAQVGGVTLNPAFVSWFNRMAALSDALYAGGSQDPHLTYTFKPVSSDGIRDINLRLDGQVLVASASNMAAKQFTWPGPVHEAKASVNGEGFFSSEGIWAVFHFFDDAEVPWLNTGAGWRIQWPFRIGKNIVTLPSGHNKYLVFELNMGGAPAIFEKGYLGRMGCVADVAK